MNIKPVPLQKDVKFMYSAVEAEDRSFTEQYLVWWTYLKNGRFLASRCMRTYKLRNLKGEYHKFFFFYFLLIFKIDI